jgi:hypothetical protein
MPSHSPWPRGSSWAAPGSIRPPVLSGCRPCQPEEDGSGIQVGMAPKVRNSHGAIMGTGVGRSWAIEEVEVMGPDRVRRVAEDGRTVGVSGIAVIILGTQPLPRRERKVRSVL